MAVCLCQNYKVRSLANILTTEEDRVTKQLFTARVTMVSVSSLSLRASRDFMFCLLLFFIYFVKLFYFFLWAISNWLSCLNKNIHDAWYVSMYNQSINVPINLNLIRITVEALYNSHLGDRRKWPLWRDGRYGEGGGGVQYDTCCAVFFFGGWGGWWVVGGVQHVYFPGPCLLYPTIAIQS